MGKTLAFWTCEKGYGDNTFMLAAMACSLGITEGLSTAVTSLPGQISAFLDFFSIRMPEKIKSGKDNTKGFYPLLQRAIFEKPTEKMVMEAAVHTINKGPLLFPWFDADESAITEKNAVTLIMRVLKDIFDYVIIDAGYGEKGEYSELLLRNADYVIVLLPQDKRRWKEYFDKQPLCGEGHFIYLMYPYFTDSYYTSGWFSHHFCRDKGEVIGVPACSDFLDACMEGRTAEFFLDAGKNKRKQRGPFIKSVSGLAKGVMEK